MLLRLKNRFASYFAPRARKKQPMRRSTFRPRLEAFEDRVVPASVAPVFFEGNPNCAAIGHPDAFGFKLEGDNLADGTYTSSDGFLEITLVNVDKDGGTFDWSSNLGIDAVIVKGGPNANVYFYDPESLGDTDLSTPINPENDKPFGLSHIEFCYDFELTISKTAETTFTRTYEWDITKESDAEYHKFIGDPATTHTYTVDVTQTGFTDSDWAVSGTITIFNDTPFDATITDISDIVSDGIVAAIDPDFSGTLDAGETLLVAYFVELPDGSDRTNTVTVTTTGDVGGGSASADVIFGEPTTEVNKTVTVTDSFAGELGTTSTSTSFTYDRDFTCPTDLDEYTDGVHTDVYENTATIEETGQSDDATVTVHCYAPVISKTADTSYTREITWTIDKKVNGQDEVNFAGEVGDSFPVTYTVTVEKTATELGYTVSGVITVTNPNPEASMTVQLSDVLSDATVAALFNAMGGTLDGDELTIEAGGTATVEYSASVNDKDSGTNTATATLNDIEFTATADYAFGDPTEVIGFETVNVTDDVEGPLGSTSETHTFTYEKTFVCETPGEHVYPNTATIVETQQSDSAKVTIVCEEPAPPEDPNTFTQGFWKNHLDAWPVTSLTLGNVNYTQAQLVQILNASVKGNGLIALAHQLIAAKLNVANGATPSAEVAAAIAGADALIGNLVVPPVGSGFLSTASTSALVEILDAFNNS